MNLHGIGQNPYGLPANAGKRKAGEKTSGSFMQAVDKMQASSDVSNAAETNSLDALKQDVYAQISAMGGSAGTSVSVQISDSAFERMQSDPQFKAEMLDIIRRDFAGCMPPITSLMINISENGYSGQSYNFGYGADRVKEHEEDSFYKRPATIVPKYDNGLEKTGDDQYSDWLREQMLLQSDKNHHVMRELLKGKDSLDLMI